MNEYLKKSKELFEKMKQNKIIKNIEAQKRVKFGSLIWVDPYYRQDGTFVKGYYREP